MQSTEAFTGKKTGAIWAKEPEARAQTVEQVCHLLEADYGRPRLGNPDDPVDDLIYIILSNKTPPLTARRVFELLKEKHPQWDTLLAAHEGEVVSILRPAGLSRVKSQQIRAALTQVRGDFDSISLNSLLRRSQTEQLEYLQSLPGVSGKVARCVMLYTMGSRVLPVDSHVHRIATRLGWTARKRPDQSHEELEALVPAKNRYAFHVACILHGRSVCRPQNPVCESCSVATHCDYYRTSFAYSKNKSVK